MKRTPIFDSFLGCIAFAGMAAVFFVDLYLSAHVLNRKHKI